ncbi:MAG: hypothetical protein ABI874_05640 [Chloroflexota bacterium]
MNQLTSEAMTWVIRFAGALLAVAIGVAWLRQEIALAAGAPRAVSELWVRLSGIVIGFIVVVSAPQIANLLRVFAQGGADALRAGLPVLAKTIVDGLIFLGSMVLALGVAGNWLSAQISIAAGNPAGLSNVWVRLFGIVFTFIGLLATIPIANVLIDWLAR